MKIERILYQFSLWNESELDLPLNSQYETWLKSQKSLKINISKSFEFPINTNTKSKTLKISRPFITHASVGLCCAIANWSKEHIQVISHSQGIFNLRHDLALAFDLAEDKINVKHHPGMVHVFEPRWLSSLSHRCSSHQVEQVVLRLVAAQRFAWSIQQRDQTRKAQHWHPALELTELRETQWRNQLRLR
jgi:hypothetical protein